MRVRVAHMWHDRHADPAPVTQSNIEKTALTWAETLRAGDGNRNRMTSLEGWGSTIELRPRDRDDAVGMPST
jgi:hypothetical protein